MFLWAILLDTDRQNQASRISIEAKKDFMTLKKYREVPRRRTSGIKLQTSLEANYQATPAGSHYPQIGSFPNRSIQYPAGFCSRSFARSSIRNENLWFMQ